MMVLLKCQEELEQVIIEQYHIKTQFKYSRNQTLFLGLKTFYQIGIQARYKFTYL